MEQGNDIAFNKVDAVLTGGDAHAVVGAIENSPTHAGGCCQTMAENPAGAFGEKARVPSPVARALDPAFGLVAGVSHRADGLVRCKRLGKALRLRLFALWVASRPREIQ